MQGGPFLCTGRTSWPAPFPKLNIHGDFIRECPRSRKRNGSSRVIRGPDRDGSTQPINAMRSGVAVIKRAALVSFSEAFRVEVSRSRRTLRHSIRGHNETIPAEWNVCSAYSSTRKGETEKSVAIVVYECEEGE